MSFYSAFIVLLALHNRSYSYMPSLSQHTTVELGIADPNKGEWDDAAAQRQMLDKGDSFYVPPGNIYRLENHSEVKTCMIHWCIIKPLEAGLEPRTRGEDQDL